MMATPMHEWQLHLFRGDALENRALGRGPGRKPEPVSLADVERELARLTGLNRVILTGGRPTEHPDFRAVVDAVRRANPEHLTLETDGAAFVDARVLDDCRALGIDELFVHVAGVTDAAHRAVHRGTEPVTAALEGVALAASSGISTYAVVTLSRPNVKDVLPLVEWLWRLPKRPKGVLLAEPDLAHVTAQDRGTLLPPRAAAELAARVFERCHAKRIEYGFRSKRGIAPCAAGGVLDRYGTIFHDRQMFFKGGGSEQLVRVRACNTCSLQDSCKGIERPLVDLFGQADLRPIPLEVSMDWKLRDLNSLGRRDYKNISPFKNAGGASERGLLRINGHCNMSCAFCFVDRTAPDFAADGLLAEIDRMTEQGTRHVVLSGGEPTLHPDLPRLVRHAAERGATTVEIQTNGVRSANLEYATELVNAGLTKVTVSLHSADAEHSDKITRLPDAFDKTIAAIRNFRKLGVVTQVAHVITKSNYKELPDTMRFLAEQFPSGEAHLSVCLAIAQGISDLVYTWVVPRFSEIRPYVREALDYCLTNDVGFGGMIGQGGYPPCMLDGELKYYERVYEHLYVSDDWTEQFYKAPKCRECAFDAHCLGVRRAYVESYGDAELKPFSAPPSALPQGAPRLRPAPPGLVPLRLGRNA
jgi:MoaA/NifB/PqqE/SkfB family radical SAM enzyme